MITPERIAAIRQKPHGPDVADMMDEIERLWAENTALRNEIVRYLDRDLSALEQRFQAIAEAANA